MSDEKENIAGSQTACKSCGAILEFKPGTTSLVCQYCGASNEIEIAEDIEIKEENYLDFIKNVEKKEDTIEIKDVKCSSCGAQISFEPNIKSEECPYCSHTIVIEGGDSTTIIKPKYLIPFAIDSKEAGKAFKDWINKLWFAPNKLKERARKDKIKGIYLPYWTYDASTYSEYTGERGEYYYTTETYTEEDADGNEVTKTREVRHTSWTPVSGRVINNFDDVLIHAGKGLSEKLIKGLNPWKLKELLPYDNKFLTGFKTESYQKDVKTGFEEAKEVMAIKIRSSAKRDIGGDEQRISTINTQYSDITFKHILLPLWISSYRYNDKVYLFLVNGQTAKVYGERPYSATKIALLVLTIIAIIVAIIYFK